MTAFHEAMIEYRSQLKKGAIQEAYRGLMQFMLDLKTHFKSSYPDYFVSGSLYTGYMDMTYFSFIPESLKQRGLKIAIVFNHEAFSFEVWLAAYNKQIQTRYWKLLKASGWKQYRLVPSPQGADSILEHTLVENPNFCDLEALTVQIEQGTLGFIQEVESFLATLENQL